VGKKEHKGRKGRRDGSKNADGSASFEQIHHGVKFQREPIFNMNPNVWIPCILHAFLRISELQFKHCILDHISVEQAEELHEALAGEQIHVKKIHAGKKSVKSCISRHSLNGRNCTSLLDCHPMLLRIAMPMNDEVSNTYRAEAEKMWKLWEIVWELLRSENETGETNDQRANLLQTSILAWAVQYRSVCGHSAGVYFHILVAHMPEFVRKYGCLSKYSAQGLEAGHYVRKQILLHCTNGKHGWSKGRKRKSGQQTMNLVSRISQLLTFELKTYEGTLKYPTRPNRTHKHHAFNAKKRTYKDALLQTQK
jgi:hypothetical protein